MINLSKKQLLICIGIGGIIVFVIGYYIYSNTSSNSYEQLEEISVEQTTENIQNVEKGEEEIVVHIAGEIKNPGIVRTTEGARIADVIDKAGGLTELADISNVNLAYIIEDGQKITIPSKTDETSKEYISSENGEGIIQLDSQETTMQNKIININKATQEELQQLQGIGESTATKIIEYRNQNGDFKQIEDLKNVPGIGDAKFEAIKGNIKLK